MTPKPRRTDRVSILGINTEQLPFSGTTFRYRFTKFTLYFLLSFVAVSCGTFIFFTYQNYEIFLKMTYDFAPDVLVYLQRERAWLSTVIVSFGFSGIVFVTFFVFRLAGQVAGPINKLHKRLKELSQGNFYQPHLRIRDNDEFQDLVQSFNYFQESLKIQTYQELKLLEDTILNIKNPKAKVVIERLAQKKREQINDFSSISEKSLDSRHVS